MQTKARQHPVRLVTLVFLAVSAAACGGGESPPDAGVSSTPSSEPAVSEISADELEFGIGPIRGLDLGELDTTLAQAGEEMFAVKCSACHKLDERYIGPALRDVTERRTAEYIMNMILNPEEMVKNHPVAKQLFAEYNFTPMANQQLSEEDARAVLEFLRQAGAEEPVAQTEPLI